MNKPWYGPVKELHQEVVCRYGSHHNIWVGSSKLIEWPEGFDCMGICMDVDCGACEGTGAIGHHIAIDGGADENNCMECNGSGKMSREQFTQYILDKDSIEIQTVKDAPGDSKNV